MKWHFVFNGCRSYLMRRLQFTSISNNEKKINSYNSVDWNERRNRANFNDENHEQSTKKISKIHISY